VPGRRQSHLVHAPEALGKLFIQTKEAAALGVPWQVASHNRLVLLVITIVDLCSTQKRNIRSSWLLVRDSTILTEWPDFLTTEPEVQSSIPGVNTFSER
jgi:hypothetical protein